MHEGTWVRLNFDNLKEKDEVLQEFEWGLGVLAGGKVEVERVGVKDRDGLKKEQLVLQGQGIRIAISGYPAYAVDGEDSDAVPLLFIRSFMLLLFCAPWLHCKEKLPIQK